MGFQDNSGDIIFDVILTDEGRRQLSKGIFEVNRFRLGDDEINYELFDTITGSAYQDLQILQTPIFEAFANNTSNMTYNLVTYTQTDFLYLPVIKLNEVFDQAGGKTATHASGTFMIAVDEPTQGYPDANDTYKADAPARNNDGNIVEGFLFGANPGEMNSGYIRLDHGIDNTSVPPNGSNLSTRAEESYLVEMDGRLGGIVDPMNGTVVATGSSEDDDGIVVYVVQTQSMTDQSDHVVWNDIYTVGSGNGQVIAGRRSTILRFKIKSSAALAESDYYFDRFGSTGKMVTKNSPSGQNIKFIDSLIKVTGVDTGYSVDVPIRYVKKTS